MLCVQASEVKETAGRRLTERCDQERGVHAIERKWRGVL